MPLGPMSETVEPYRQPRNLNKGRIVIQRLYEESAAHLVERPAIVVRVWDKDVIDVCVFPDGFDAVQTPHIFTQSRYTGASKEPGSWCWCDEQDMSEQGA